MTKKSWRPRIGALVTAALVGLSPLALPSTAQAFTDGIWATVGGTLDMQYGRVAPLSNGDAFTAAGDNNNAESTPMSVYKRGTNKWVAGPVLPGGRYNPVTAMLPGRKGLIAGGQVGGQSTDETFIFDEATMTAAPGAPMPYSVLEASSVTLPNNRVVVFGGYHQDDTNPGSPVDTVQIYRPNTGTWSLGAPMPVRLERAGVALLDDGRVAVAGGDPVNLGDELRLMIYDPALNTWSEGAPKATGSIILKLPGNRLFTFDFTHISVWDAATDTWTAGPQLPWSGVFGWSTLSDGDILLSAREDNVLHSFVYRQATGVFETIATMPFEDVWTGVNLQDGSLLTAGRSEATPGNNSFLYKPAGVISQDAVAPVLGSLTFTHNPQGHDKPNKLSVNVTDDSSGVVRVEYFLAGESETPGDGHSMQWDGTTAKADLPALDPEVHKVNVRAQDGAGNWSPISSTYLVVYYDDPDARATADDARFVPASGTSDDGDVFPFMPAQESDFARVNFNVHSHANGTAAGTFSLRFRENANNRMIVQSTSEQWVALRTATDARFSGVATVQTWVSGALVTRDMKYIVTLRDGFFIGQSDRLKVRLFELTQNIYEDAPTYQLSGQIDSGDVAISGVPFVNPGD